MAYTVRFRVFIRRPHSFPTLSAGENELLAEPVVFFHKDSQVNLDFTILNPDGTEANLTGATAELLVKPERGAAETFACTLVDAGNGLIRRTVTVGDFDAGSYKAQVKITTSGSSVFHTVVFRILVAEALL